MKLFYIEVIAVVEPGKKLNVFNLKVLIPFSKPHEIEKKLMRFLSFIFLRL